MKTKYLSLNLLFFALSISVFGQEKLLDVGISAKINLALGEKRLSFQNTSLALSVAKQPTENTFQFIPTAQFAIHFYNKALGTSIHKQFRKGQIDFVSTFLVSTGFNTSDTRQFPIPIQPFHQYIASSIAFDMDYFLYYGTSFILTNNGRNQHIGNFGFNIHSIGLGYYNDGFIPFEFFTSDGFDRYWTGGGHVRLNFRLFREDAALSAEENILEFTYDRFTGDVQDAYVFSKVLYLYGVLANNADNVFLNRALTSISWRNRWGTHLSLGRFGHCKGDIQDRLHDWLGNSRHLSFAACTWVFMGGYQKNFQHQISAK